jgi:hypothetical protein
MTIQSPSLLKLNPSRAGESTRSRLEVLQSSHSRELLNGDSLLCVANGFSRDNGIFD